MWSFKPNKKFMPGSKISIPIPTRQALPPLPPPPQDPPKRTKKVKAKVEFERYVEYTEKGSVIIEVDVDLDEDPDWALEEAVDDFLSNVDVNSFVKKHVIQVEREDELITDWDRNNEDPQEANNHEALMAELESKDDSEQDS